jgi:hypothetical protein
MSRDEISITSPIFPYRTQSAADTLHYKLSDARSVSIYVVRLSLWTPGWTCLSGLPRSAGRVPIARDLYASDKTLCTRSPTVRTSPKLHEANASSDQDLTSCSCIMRWNWAAIIAGAASVSSHAAHHAGDAFSQERLDELERKWGIDVRSSNPHN